MPVTETPVRVHNPSETEASSSISPAVSTTEFGCDLFFARYLWKSNHILWASGFGQPDFGGKEVQDQRLLLEMEEATVSNFTAPAIGLNFTLRFN